MNPKYFLVLLCCVTASIIVKVRAAEGNPVELSDKAGYRMKLSPRAVWPDYGIGEAREVTVFGNYAFVLAKGEIVMFDISDPANPRKEGGFSPGIQSFLTIVSDGNYVYGVTAGNDFTDSELSIWDVRDAAHPVKAGSLPLRSPGYGAVIRKVGHIVFVVERYDSLNIIDVSDPRHPTQTAEYRSPFGSIHSIAVSGDRLYLTGGGSGSLEVIDISTPAAPKLLRSQRFPGRDGGFLEAIEVAGDYAFATGWDGDSYLGVFDISDPQGPVRVSRLSGGYHSFKVAGSLLYAVDWDKVQIFDLSNPASLRSVGRISGFFFSGIDVVEQKVYAANFSEGFNIFETSNPTSPRRLGGWGPSAAEWASPQYRAIALSGNYAYVSTYKSDDSTETGLLVFDITDPDKPQFTTRLPLPEASFVLKVSGNVLYDGHHVIDVSDPRSPKIAAEYASGANFTIAGQFLYIVDTALRIVDVSNPSSPALAAKLQLQYAGSEIQVSGIYAVITGFHTVWIVDVGNPSAPLIVGKYSLNPEDNPDMALSGNYAFLGTWHQSDDPLNGIADYYAIDVLDLSDPTHPVRVATHPMPGPGHISTMRIAGNRLYIRRHESLMPGEFDFLTVMDIRNPRAMFQVAEFGNHQVRYAPFGQFRDFAVNDQGVFLVGHSLEIDRTEFVPELGISNHTGRIQLNWPNVDSAFQLQRKPDLGRATAWTNVAATPTLIDGQNHLTVAPDSGANFFRLEKP